MFALITRKWNKKDKWREMAPSSLFCPRNVCFSRGKKNIPTARIRRKFGWKFTVAYLSSEYFSCLLNYTLIHISNRRWVQGLHMLGWKHWLLWRQQKESRDSLCLLKHRKARVGVGGSFDFNFPFSYFITSKICFYECFHLLWSQILSNFPKNISKTLKHDVTCRFKDVPP